MARFRLGANAEIDLLTNDELKGTMHDELRSWSKEWSERGRAEKYIEQTFTFSTPATIGPTAGVVLTDNTGNGSPRAGYAWAIRMLNTVLVTAAILNVWKVADVGSTNPANYVRGYGRGTSNVINNFPYSSLQFVLKTGEYVALNTQGAQTLASAWFAAVEVPEGELWKVE